MAISTVILLYAIILELFDNKYEYIFVLIMGILIIILYVYIFSVRDYSRFFLDRGIIIIIPILLIICSFLAGTIKADRFLNENSSPTVSVVYADNKNINGKLIFSLNDYLILLDKTSYKKTIKIRTSEIKTITEYN
jgi:amino acid transporter